MSETKEEKHMTALCPVGCTQDVDEAYRRALAGRLVAEAQVQRLTEERDAARRELAEVQAQAAALRVVVVREMACDEGSDCDNCDDMRRAIAPDAGRVLLAELATLRARCEAGDALLEAVTNHRLVSRDPGETLFHTVGKALAAYRAARAGGHT